jgi:hypothetical protein
MANRKQYYPLPDYKNVTEDLDTYIEAWRLMALPVEKALNLKLTAYDPNFIFTKGNPQGESTSVILPVWLVRDLSAALS